MARSAIRDSDRLAWCSRRATTMQLSEVNGCRSLANFSSITRSGAPIGSRPTVQFRATYSRPCGTRAGRPNGWPYGADNPADLAAWLPPSGAAPIFKRAGEVGGNTADAIIAELDQGRPVVTSIKLSHSFDWARPDGIVDQHPNEMPSHLRRHAVVSVGHGTVEGQRAILVRNSWGGGWADGGYAWLTEAFLLPRVIRLAILKEDLSVSPPFRRSLTALVPGFRP